MKKIAKKIKEEISIHPIDISLIKVEDDDCFGVGWDSLDEVCIGCTMFNTCAILVAKNKIKKPNHNFFDRLDWSVVDWDKIAKTIKDNPNEFTYDEVYNIIDKKVVGIDPKTLAIKIKLFFIDNQIKITKGTLC